jgi:hypothetical protein
MRIIFSIFAGLLLIVALSFSASAQDGAYAKGDKYLNVGVGLLLGYSTFGVGGSFDVAVHDLVSVGAAAEFGIGTYTTLPIALRAAFHPFNLDPLKDKIKIRDKLDAYAGLIGGFGIHFSDYYSGGYPIYGYIVGARYNLNPNLRLYLESSWGLGTLNGGIALKF